MKKSQKIIPAMFLVLLAGSLIVTGCPLEPEKVIEYVNVTRDKLIGFDVVVSDQAGLRSAVAGTGGYILVKSDISLTSSSLTVPAGKTVYLFANLDTSGQALTVAGSVVIADTGTLTASSSGPVTVTGNIRAEKGGTLAIDDAASVTDGANTALGTSKVAIAGGSLAYDSGSAFSTTAAIQTALAYVSSGLLDITGSGLKPSDFSAFSGASATKQLNINLGSTAETESSLTIPANLTITTTDDLDTVTNLTVNGSLTASGATLNSSSAALTLGAGANAVLGTVKLTGTSTVGANGALTAKGEIAGTLTLGGTLTILSGGIVTVSGSIVYPSMGYRITGLGTIKTTGGGTLNLGMHGVYTTPSGVIANSFIGVIQNLMMEVMQGKALVNSIALPGDYIDSPTLAIGTVEITSDAAPATVTKSGTDLAVYHTSLALESNPSGSAVSGTHNAAVSAGDFTLSLASEKVQISDSAYNGSGTDKYVVVSFPGAKLTVSNLITEFEPFKVGVKTKR
jgi:hypothetical protein